MVTFSFKVFEKPFRLFKPAIFLPVVTVALEYEATLENMRVECISTLLELIIMEKYRLSYFFTAVLLGYLKYRQIFFEV